MTLLTVLAVRMVTQLLAEELAIFDHFAFENVFLGADQKITLP